VVFRRGERTVLDAVDVDVMPGVLGLLGPNGAGKTTLLRVLATALWPAAGEVSLLGTSVSRRMSDRALREVRARVGYLPQRVPVLPWFTAAEFVAYVGWAKGMSSSRARTRAYELLEVVELADRADDRIRSMSGGMVQRVGIAQALVNDPDVVLLDEPTAGLDPRQRVQFRQLVHEVGRRSAVVLSTHLVDDVGPACDRVVVLDRGRTVFEGDADALAGRGRGSEPGDSPLERGFHAVVGRP
jgi:ABC-type multidrug transport system ATPase subunit